MTKKSFAAWPHFYVPGKSGSRNVFLNVWVPIGPGISHAAAASFKSATLAPVEEGKWCEP